MTTNVFNPIRIASLLLALNIFIFTVLDLRGQVTSSKLNILQRQNMDLIKLKVAKVFLIPTD